MIGVFDSGLGGLTALKEIRRLLPGEELVYFGDTGRIPYGTRSRETIIKYALQDMRFLTSFGIKAAVAACGTISTTAIDDIRREFAIPVIGVVEGASEAAVNSTKNGIVAVIGTSATIKSGAFERKLHSLSPSVKTVSLPCPLLVPLVENGFISRGDEITAAVCRRYLEPIRQSGADTLILGCTHYPIIAETISDVLPGVKLISTGAEAAKRLASMLSPESKELSVPAPVHYYVTDDPAMFNESASLFLGGEISGDVRQIDIEQY